jgi:hypothetical protein
MQKLSKVKVIPVGITQSEHFEKNRKEVPRHLPRWPLGADATASQFKVQRLRFKVGDSTDAVHKRSGYVEH